MPNSSSNERDFEAECGEVDPITEAVCSKTDPHEVHRDVSGGLQITWKTVKPLIKPGDE